MSGRPKGIKSRPSGMSVAEWIRQLCIEDDNGCLVWPRAKQSKGYGSISPGDGRSPMSTHVVIFEERHGAVPDGLMVAHTCRNRLCCNIDHLQLSTPKENAGNAVDSRSKINAAKTHCKRGHEFNEDNTFVQTKNRPGGVTRVERVCRLCRNELQAEYRARDKEVEADVSCD